MNWLKSLSHDTAAAMLAWAATAIICSTLLIIEQPGVVRIILTSVGFLLFGGLLLVVAGNSGAARRRDHVFLGLEYLTICLLYFVIPYDYIAILMVIWSAQMAWFIPFKNAFILSVFWSSPLWLAGEFYWEKDQAWVSAILFWSFNVFGIFMITMTRHEQEAREEIERKRRELESTQYLLSEAAAQSERLRIARDIHDVIGHQLTALTMNLQAANRGLADVPGGSQEFVGQASKIAKNLLKDIRATVSEIRDEREINLLSAVLVLTDNLPHVRFELSLDEVKHIDDVATAETILRFVQEATSNALRHGRASFIQIKATKAGGKIVVEIIDNGKGFSEKKSYGNGLKGLSERAQSRGGDLSISSQPGVGTHATMRILA